MKKFTKLICLATMVASLAACTDEDYPLYDTSQKDSVFFDYVNTKDEPATSMEYAFNFNPDNFYVVDIPITLMGMPIDRDRQIELHSVKSENNAEMKEMVEGTHYVIESAVLPANAIQSVVKVKLLRDKDPQIQQENFTVTLEIGENEDLRSVGQKCFTITYNDIRPERPEWWVSYAPFPEFSFENCQWFFRYFYELGPKLNQDTYNEMIKAYGHYFMNAKKDGGPFAYYRTFVTRILMAMYKDDPDPAKWPKGEPKL